MYRKDSAQLLAAGMTYRTNNRIRGGATIKKACSCHDEVEHDADEVDAAEVEVPTTLAFNRQRHDDRRQRHQPKQARSLRVAYDEVFYADDVNPPTTLALNRSRGRR